MRSGMMRGAIAVCNEWLEREVSSAQLFCEMYISRLMIFYFTAKRANEFTLHTHRFVPLSYTRDHKFVWWDFMTLLKRMRGIVLERVKLMSAPSQRSARSDTRPPIKILKYILYKAKEFRREHYRWFILGVSDKIAP